MRAAIAAGTVLLLLGSAASAVTVDVSQTFNFSSDPITLTPFNDGVDQSLGAGQYITLNVNFAQTFSSFGDLEVTGVISGIPSPDYISAVRWGNYTLSNGWPPAYTNNGATWLGGGAIRTTTTWLVGFDYGNGNVLDSSYYLNSIGYNLLVSQIDSGTFPISLSLCSAFCETSPYTWNGPVTFSSLTVELIDATPSVPELSTWAMLLIGFAGLGLYASVKQRWRRFA